MAIGGDRGWWRWVVTRKMDSESGWWWGLLKIGGNVGLWWWVVTVGSDAGNDASGWW